MINRTIGTAVSTAAAALLVMAVAPRMAIAQGPGGVIIVVGETEGAPGDSVSFDVTLDTGGLEVAGTQNDIVFDPSTPIVAAENGNPQCWVNPDIDKSATAFRFQPAGCEDMGIGLCTGIRALVLSISNLDPIPDGSVMYGCDVAIATDAPAEIFPLVNDNVGSTDPEGITLPTLGEDGAVTVVVGPPPTPTPMPTSPPPPTPMSTPPPPPTPTSTTPPPFSGDNDSCQVVAPADSQTGWLLLVPVAALFWMRRRSRLH